MTESDSRSFWGRLLHRWLIEYNPLYLLSAALVLGGVLLLSGGLARSGSVYGQLGVAAIAELYAWALIGGAALLTRIGLRRPAVMLALLTALYQCDPTLHTETCAYLGWVGVFGSASWLAIFVAKLRALAWAIRLRLSRSALLVPTFGALGLVLVPRLLPALDPGTAATLLASWVFSLFASALWSGREVSSAVRLDDWGSTVLRRGLRAAWLMWALLALSHVWFWSDEHAIGLGRMLPVALLLVTRFVRRESTVWIVVGATLLLVGSCMPAAFALCAALAAVVLALRALRQPTFDLQSASAPAPAPPYRAPAGEVSPPPRVRPRLSFCLASPEARLRLLSGALFGVYLSAWTRGWSGGPWPEHVLPLDLAFTAAAAMGAWKLHARIALLPLAGTYAHLAVQTGTVSAPETVLGWGAASVSAGFGLLLASLAASWRYRQPKSGAPQVFDWHMQPATQGAPKGRSDAHLPVRQ